jgi:hypothetical protein
MQTCQADSVRAANRTNCAMLFYPPVPEAPVQEPDRWQKGDDNARRCHFAGRFHVDEAARRTLVARGWAVLVVGSAHHVETAAERASIISADADPFPWPEADAAPLMRVRPGYIRGRRSYPRAIPAER